MKFKNLLKFSLGAVFVLPMTLLFGTEIFENNFSDNYQLKGSQEKLLACGGGGGMSPAAKKEKKARQAKAKLNFKKRKLAEKAAAGESTDVLQAEIAELESLLLEK